MSGNNPKPATGAGQPKGKPKNKPGPQQPEPNPFAGDDPLTKSLFPVRPERKSPPPGRVVKLFTNLFRMSIVQNKEIYQYGITVNLLVDKKASDKEPRKLGNIIRGQAVKKAIEEWTKNVKPKDFSRDLKFNYVLDINASAMYALFDMFIKRPDGKLEFEVQVPSDRIIDMKLCSVEIAYEVTFHKVAKVNVRGLFDYCVKKGCNSNRDTILEPIRALNVILRGELCTIPCNVMTPTAVFPFKKENQMNVSEGVMVNKGYSTSVRPTETGVVLNIANTVGAFHETVDLLTMLQRQFRCQDFSKRPPDYIIESMKKEIRNKKVEAIHRNFGTKERPHFRQYRVTDIGGSCEDIMTLRIKDSDETEEMTIAQYFMLTYNCKIKYPKLPCVIDKGSKIPLELCRLIEKQRVMRKMTGDETSKILKIAAVKPEVYFSKLKENVDEISANSRPLTDFGLKFQSTPIMVEGRELPPIKLLGAGRAAIHPSNGEYRAQSGFVRPALGINNWTIAIIVDRFNARDISNPSFENSVRDIFVKNYCQVAKEKGVTIDAKKALIQYIPDSKGATFDNLRDNDAKAMLKKYFNYLNGGGKVDHALIILPKNCQDWVYGYLQYLEVTQKSLRKPGEMWARSSCIKYDNFVGKILRDKFGGKMFISNLWLKHNTKLGGINFVLNNDQHINSVYLQPGYIFISVDVCHPAPGDKLIQSVAAVVGMWDLTNPNMSFCTRLKVQKKVKDERTTREDVAEIGSMVGEILDAYKAKKNALPAKIVILRDGVSDGQYKIVLGTELVKVKTVLKSKYGAAIAPITCLVVQKRHKVKFMREDPVKDRRGENDFNIQPGTVVDKDIVNDFSFYVAPHKTIQGTTRAPHIYMICDENNFSQEQAQSMILALSYLSPRCNKSTSIPTPVNLADLAAERGKNIVISWNEESRQKMDEEERLKALNTMLSTMGDANYKNTLYYV